MDKSKSRTTESNSFSADGPLIPITAGERVVIEKLRTIKPYEKLEIVRIQDSKKYSVIVTHFDRNVVELPYL